MEPTVITVSQLNDYIKVLFEQDPLLTQVIVKGEISNFTNHIKSGHMYMSIKDDKSVIRAVMFAGQARKLPFVPENGMKVIVTARVSVFPRDGQYQLYLSDMQPDGVGALHIAFEQLKERLRLEGLFDESRKKPLPKTPLRIGVVTSPTGAAVRDMINVLGRRFPAAKVFLFPVLVQGPGAAPEIVDAIRQFNEHQAADVLIVGRGGGSIEELWAFNEEVVARAIADSRIPIISAVGHETDFTIADFVADLRAPTPSAAAELCVPSSAELKHKLLNYNARVAFVLETSLKKRRQAVQTLRGNRVFESPKNYIDDRRMNLLFCSQAMAAAMQRRLSTARQRFGADAAKLDALSPLSLLNRGFLIAQKEGAVVKNAAQLDAGDSLTLQFSDGLIDCAVTGKTMKGEKDHG